MTSTLHTRVVFSPEKILILRLSSIGDVVLISPVLRGLRRQFPHAVIDVVVKEEFADLVRYHPSVNAVHVVRAKSGMRGLWQLGQELRRRGYGTVLDLHRNFRTTLLGLLCAAPQRLGHRKHRVRRWLYVRFKVNTMAETPPIVQRYLRAAAPLGVRDDGEGTDIFWAQLHEAEAQAALLAAGWRHDQKLIGLAPGAGYFTKRWPPEYFSELIHTLLRDGQETAFAILGGPEDCDLGKIMRGQPQGRILDLTGRCSLLASAAIIKRCQLLVANDSGLMHIAEAVRTPLLALFGSTTKPLGFFPQRSSSRVLENSKLHCRPCSHLGYHACPQGHFRCMREIAPAEVYQVIQTMMAESLSL